jgi:hypothetical protein
MRRCFTKDIARLVAEILPNAGLQASKPVAPVLMQNDGKNGVLTKYRRMKRGSMLARDHLGAPDKSNLLRDRQLFRPYDMKIQIIKQLNNFVVAIYFSPGEFLLSIEIEKRIGHITFRLDIFVNSFIDEFRRIQKQWRCTAAHSQQGWYKQRSAQGHNLVLIINNHIFFFDTDEIHKINSPMTNIRRHQEFYL